MIGQTISHYRITRQLGEGGMGVVYEAEDLDLKVTRALKFLPPHTAVSDEDRRRLEREARAAAGLEHENICQVHEIGRDSDHTFIVMSYLEGQTLADRLTESGPLAVTKALDIAIQVGGALSRAHGAGIVHRDIKPANIMLTEGEKPVVMDFGLARGSDLTRVTRTGATIGTAAYMSPEQAKGDPVDARSDIWSLGVVLYEILAGTVPFAGDHLAAVAYAVQFRDHEPLKGLRPEVPADLERVIGRALAKDPAQRYQTVDDFLADLKAVRDNQEVDGQTLRQDRIRQLRKPRVWIPGLLITVLLVATTMIIWPRQDKIQSLAVLPFANLTGAEEQEILAEGMTGELIFKLSRLESLPRVISRQTIMKYRDSNLPLPEIARELRVDAIVESSLLEIDGKIKASVKLMEARTEVTLWADTYERPIDNILGLYEQMTRDIALAIDLELSSQEIEELETAAVVNPAAYEAYLKGMFWVGRDKDLAKYAKAVAFFEEAIDLDPEFAPAYAGLAQTHNNLLFLDSGNRIEHLKNAKEAATKALDLDPHLAEVRSTLANVYMTVDGDWEATERQWALISPRDRARVVGYPFFLCLTGRFTEAAQWSRDLLEKDPMSLKRMNDLAMSLRFARRFDEALPEYENLLEYYSDEFWGKYGLLHCYVRLGRKPEAEAALTALEKTPYEFGYGDYLILGDRARVQGVVRKLLQLIEEKGKRDEARELARHYAWLGEREQALAWMKVASEEFPHTLMLNLLIQEFDFLRSEPEFSECLRKAGFTEEMVAASKLLTSDIIVGDS